jgi:cysteine desulfurase
MRVYLDNNATTPADPLVIEALANAMRSGPLNPGSMHASGQHARRMFEAARDAMLEMLGLPDRRLVFCASATEAVNLAMRGIAQASGTRPVSLHTSVEHPAVVATAAAIGGVRIAPVGRDGSLDVEAWRQGLSGATLASCMFANNETGGLLPLVEASRLCREAGVPLLVDACQSPGKADFFGQLPAIDPDLLVFSGQKIHGPVGIAALVVKKQIALRQQTTGGGQQGGFRAGTEPVALAVALECALRLARDRFDPDRLRARTRVLWQAIQRAAPEAMLTIPDSSRRLSNTLHYRIPGLSAQRQVVAFDLAGVECSSASACESGAAEPSKVLLGMGYSREEALEGVRLSISRMTTDAEIAAASAAMETALGRMIAKGRTMHPASAQAVTGP